MNALALEPDGRIILAGLFDTFDGVPRRNLARLHRGFETNLVILNFAPFPINHAVAEDAGLESHWCEWPDVERRVRRGEEQAGRYLESPELVRATLSCAQPSPRQNAVCSGR